MKSILLLFVWNEFSFLFHLPEWFLCGTVAGLGRIQSTIRQFALISRVLLTRNDQISNQ